MEIASKAEASFGHSAPKPRTVSPRDSAVNLNPVSPSLIRQRLRSLERYGSILLWGSDMFTAMAAWFLAFAIRASLPGMPPLIDFMAATGLPEWTPFFFLLSAFTLFVYAYGGYGRGRPFWVVPTIIKAALTGWLLLLIISYVFKWNHLNRPFLFILAGCLILMLTLEWFAIRTLFIGLRRVGLGCRRVLIVGTSKAAAWVLHDFTHAPGAGVKLLGLVTDEESPKLPEDIQTRVFKGIARTARLAAKTHAEEVVLCLPEWQGAQLVNMLQALWPLGVRVYVLSPDLSVYLRRADLPQHAFHGLALLDYGRSPMSVAHPISKRLFDLFFGSILLLFLSPLLLAIGLIIWITNGRPILYLQERCGTRGRPFKMWKFRTMKVDAENQLKDIRAHNEADGPIFKMKNDPRITPIGFILRRHSLDELPQLWNVLRGQMSLVGPRPPLASEVEKYLPWHHARLAGVVGCTGLWQVSGRSDLRFDEMAMLDIYYLHNMNSRVDAKILLRTVGTVLAGHGAY